MKGILTMSHREIDRIKIISQIEDSLLSVEEAAELLSLSQRQVYRIKKKIILGGG